MALDTPQLAQLIVFKAQAPLGVLVEGFGGPAVEIRGQDAFRFPVPPIGGVESRRLIQFQFIRVGSDDPHSLTLEAFHRHHFAEGPPQSVVDLERAVGFGRNTRAELLELCPAILDQHPAVLGTAADPVLAQFLHHADQRPAAVPTVEEHDVERQFPSDSLLYQVGCQLGFGPEDALAHSVGQQAHQIAMVAIQRGFSSQLGGHRHQVGQPLLLAELEV